MTALLLLLLCAASGTYLELQDYHEGNLHQELSDSASVRSRVFAIYTDVLDSAQGGCEGLRQLWTVPEMWQGSCSERQEREQTEQSGHRVRADPFFAALPPRVFKGKWGWSWVWQPA